MRFLPEKPGLLPYCDVSPSQGCCSEQIKSLHRRNQGLRESHRNRFKVQQGLRKDGVSGQTMSKALPERITHAVAKAWG